MNGIGWDKHPNAQKWTVEVVKDYLIAIEKEAAEGDSLFLGKALVKQKLYRHVWSYWKTLFLNDEEVIETMLRIESIFESKLLEGALLRKLSPWVAVLALKYNYNWTENPMQKHKDPVMLKYR